MPITITGSVIVQDNNGQQHTINSEDIPFEESQTEQAQGSCITHEGRWEGKDWSVDISVEEYPSGACNGHTISTENCTVVKDNIKCQNGGVEKD